MTSARKTADCRRRWFRALPPPATAGDELAVVEAMKMRNVLRAEQDGVVAAVVAEPGTVLACDEVILEFS